jgi:hypothetical protein
MPFKSLRRWQRSPIRGWLAFLYYLAAVSGVSVSTATDSPASDQRAASTPNMPTDANPPAAPQGIPSANSPANSVAPAPDDAPVRPDALPNLEDHVKKLWEVPVPEPVLTAPTAENSGDPTEPSRIGANGGQATGEPAPQAAVDFRNDPIARTAMYNAQSNAAAFTNGVGGFGSPAESAFLPALSNTAGAGFVFGPATIHPSLNFGATYENYTGASSLNANNGFHPTAGGAFNISIGMPDLRRTLAVDYSGLYIFGRDDSNLRPFTQRFALRGNYAFTKLEFGIGVTYEGLSGNNRDLGVQVNEDLLTIALTGTYHLTQKTSIDLDVAVPVQRYSTGNDSTGVTITSFLNYQYTPKTIIGIGGAVGLTEIQGEDTQRFLQILAHSTVAASPELSFSATVGTELLDAGDTQKLIPIFGLGATWTPRLGTSFALTADRRPQNSATSDSENYVSTSVGLSATQRLGSWVQLKVSFSFEDARYYSIGDTSSPSSAGAADTANRHDDLYVGQVGLTAELNKRWSALLQYSYTKNISNTSDAFNDSRAQFQLTFNF